MRFYEVLRNLIEERELTQKRLAADLRIPVSTLGGYVQGTSEPDFDTLILFAKYFSVSTDDLLGLPSPISNSEKEADLLRVFRTLSSEEQLVFIEQGKAFRKINHKK